MADFLGKMADLSRERCKRAQKRRTHTAWVRLASERPSPRPLALRPGKLEVIAEIKRRAPSAGLLNAAVDVAAQARAYEGAGACAISVLTEPTEFLGRDEDVSLAAASVQTPVMRKDFLVDAFQVMEARAMGADGVLLIAAILPGPELAQMLAAAHDAGLFALVEAFDARDIAHALAAGATHIGVNCRNLRDLSVEFARFELLRRHIPSGVHAIAESGIKSAADFARVRELGYDAALIGSALMESGDAREALNRLRGISG